jgi:chaperonin GroES
MKIKPLHDNVILKRIEEDERTKGGIIIPDSAKESPDEGEIVAVGPGKRDKDGKVTKLEVKKGDKVIFSKYAGTEIKVQGVEYMILSEENILGIVTG